MTRWLFLFTLLFVSTSQAAAWKVVRSWSESEEKAYSAWVEAEWTQDIFKKGILNGIETDCADASYAMRALYAYRRGLPIRVTTMDGIEMDESTTQFDAISDPDQRFRSFLIKLVDETDTRTLARDTLPVTMNRAGLRAGTVYVEPGEHSYQIVGVSNQGVPVLFSSTTPRANRVLFRTLSFPFYRPESKQAADGFRAFRWPEEIGRSVRELPRAAFDQYAVKGNVLEFAETVRKKLALRDETLAERIDREHMNVCYFARDRAFQVVKAHLARLDSERQCLTGGSKSEFSTPLRDKRLAEYFSSLRALRKDPRWTTLDDEHRKLLVSVFVSTPMTESLDDEACVVPIGLPHPRALRLSDVWQGVAAGKISSDPNHSILARWGLERGVSLCQ